MRAVPEVSRLPCGVQLVELLVGLAIVDLLAALLIPPSIDAAASAGERSRVRSGP